MQGTHTLPLLPYITPSRPSPSLTPTTPPLQIPTSLTVGGSDIDVLKHVHTTAVTSNKLMNELQQMKSKLYSLENNYRHVHDH